MNAPAATRSYDTGHLRVGAVTIPISVFTATTERSSETKQFSPAGNPIGIKRYDKVTGEEVEFADIVTMHQTKHGPVAIDPSETEELLDVETKTITLTSFIPVTEALTTMMPKAFRSLEPAQTKTSKGKRDSLHAQRQWSALLAAMSEIEVAGVGEFVTRGRPYPVVLFPTGMMYEVMFDDQIREPREDKTVPVEDEAILRMAQEIEPLLDKPIDLTDHRREVIQKYAEAKAEAMNSENPNVTTTDLIAVLQASIAETERKSA